MLNKIVLQGRFTKDPELRRTPQGTEVASFSIACDRGGKDKGCDFVDIVAWRNTAEFISKYFRKGDMVLLEGRLQVRTYQDKDTGKNRNTYEVVADSAHFCGTKNESSAAAPVAMQTAAPAGFEIVDDSTDLPF